MSAVEAPVSGRAPALRRAFDATFALSIEEAPAAGDDFLSIRLGGDFYALRLTEVAGIFADRKITSLPTGVTELTGLAGFRGAMVPVYDLAALMHYPPAGAARWMAIAATAPVGFTFDRFEGHVRCPSGSIASALNSQVREHVRDVVHGADRGHFVIDLPSVIAAIRARAGAAAS